MESKKVALVTGGNRGLGLETSKELAKKGYQVILTARDEKKGKEAVEYLNKEGLSVQFHALDVTNEKSIETIFQWIDKKFGRLDVLINNAAILIDQETKADHEKLSQTLETNVIAPYLLSRSAAKLMAKNKYGRIVNVSSQMGQLHSMVQGYDAYRISKTALNAVTRIVASELKKDAILVNSVCPGWVKTDMGGAEAPLSIEEGVDTIVWAAELPNGGPTGKFLQKRKEIEW